MDEYEGVADGHYRRKSVRVRCDIGEELEAVTYVAGESFLDDSLVPTDDYLRTILQGARDHGLPQDYVREIESAAMRDHGYTAEQQGPV